MKGLWFVFFGSGRARCQDLGFQIELLGRIHTTRSGIFPH